MSGGNTEVSITEQMLLCLRDLALTDHTVRVDKLTADNLRTASLAGDANLDSLTIVEYAMALEERFDLEIDDEDLYSAKTFDDLYQLIHKKVYLRW